MGEQAEEQAGIIHISIQSYTHSARAFDIVEVSCVSSRGEETKCSTGSFTFGIPSVTPHMHGTCSDHRLVCLAEALAPLVIRAGPEGAAQWP